MRSAVELAGSVCEQEAGVRYAANPSLALAGREIYGGGGDRVKSKTGLLPRPESTGAKYRLRPPSPSLVITAKKEEVSVAEEGRVSPIARQEGAYLPRVRLLRNYKF